MLEDVAAMTRFERGSATAAHWSGQQYQDLFAPTPASPERLILVAVEEENLAVAGFLIARHVSPEWELENVVVAAEARGKGIGTRLLQDLLSHAQLSKSETIFLEVRESNTPARRLYERVGFVEAGRRKLYYANPLEGAVLYRKTLRLSPISV